MKKRLILTLAILAIFILLLTQINAPAPNWQDYLNIEGNTEQCLTTCEAVFTITNPTPNDITLQGNDVKIWHKVAKNGKGLTKEIEVYKEETINYNVEVPDYGTCYELIEKEANLSSCSDIGCQDYNPAHCNCSYSCQIGSHQEQRIKKEFKPFSFSGKKLKKGETWRIKLIGHKKVSLEENNVDWLINFKGMQPLWAWWNSSYNYRYPIINNQTIEYAISVNDTSGINGTIIWSLIGNSSYVYSTAPGPSDTIAIANETDEKYWENETSRTGNSPASVWGANAKGIWHFGEGTGTDVHDSSGNNNDGTTVGSPTWNSSGKFGYGMNFDASDDYINLGNDASLDVLEVSYGCWFYANSLHQGFLFEKYDGVTNRPFMLYTYDTGLIYLTITNSEGTQYGNATPYEADTWYFIVVTYKKNDAVRIYLNGSEVVLTPVVDYYLSTNDVNLNIGRNLYLDQNTFDGIIDEAFVYDRVLNADEILQMYNNGINNLTRLGSEEVDDTVAPTWSNPETDASNLTKTGETVYFNITLEDNQKGGYYTFSFDDGTGSFVNDTPEAWTTPGEVQVIKTITALRNTTVRWKWFFNDSSGNNNITDTWNFTVAWTWNIIFNVTDSYTSADLDDATISCNYTLFNQAGDNTNPYGPYSFPNGTWKCTFERAFYFDKTITFTADSDKTVPVSMSESGKLSIEEHSWLEALYNCIINGQCEAFEIWQSTNQTVWDIWRRIRRTDRSVITFENITNDVLNPPTQHITIDYTINIPFKEGYSNGELLPLRMYFWFHDGTICYNQDKTKDAWNRAESPYCFPLVAETLGPNNGTINFTVTLNPNIPSGTYTEANITRTIEIDPLFEGVRRWTNYGQEVIGTIKVLKSGDMTIKLENTGESYATSETLDKPSITGNVIGNVKEFFTNNQVFVLILVGIICITIVIISNNYFKHKRKW